MLICHIYPHFPPHKLGGVQKWIFALSQFLSKSAEDMRFLLLTDRSNLYYYARSSKKAVYDSLKVYRLGPHIFNVIYYSSRIRWKIIEKLSLLQLFHEAVNLPILKEADIFHLHGVWLYKEYKQYMDLAFMLSRFFNKPLVISLHGDVVGESGEVGMPLFKPEVVKILSHAKAITTFSPIIFEILSKLGFGPKSYLVPNFVDIESFKRPTPRDYRSATRLLVVSRLDPEKDPITIIKAFKYVKEKMPSSSLTIIGNGSMYNELHHLIHASKLDDEVVLKGTCTENVKKNFLWNSDIFIVTRASYIAMLEAWAAGLPVVGCNEGIIGLSIHHGKNGILFQSGSPKELAKAIIRLMKNERLRKKLAFNGMQTVKNYDIRNIAPKIKEIYRYCKS